jgi:hypothetical protein
VIIITANDSLEGCRKAWQNGAWDYVAKNSIDYNPWEEVDKSIEKLMFHLQKRNGHEEDRNWVDDNRENLLERYINKYIAVLHRDVVASADNRKELINTLLERQISPYLAYIESFRLELSDKKTTVFVEGLTDIAYLNKAIEIFGRDDLKQKIEITVVGEKQNSSKGTKGNGESNMRNAFAFLKENPDRRGERGILFLFDNDVKDNNLPNKGKNYKNIHVKRMSDYLPSNSGVSGIESFFDTTLYEEGFKKGWITKSIKHDYQTGELREELFYSIKRKGKFAEWVIDNRANQEVFSKFEGILEVIDDFLNCYNS